MIKTVRELISSDHQIPLQMMEEELKISRKTVYKILVKDLGKWKICVRFFCTVWLMNRRLSDYRLLKSLFSLWMMIVLAWLNCNG
jgi:hypothetical protein